MKSPTSTLLWFMIGYAAWSVVSLWWLKLILVGIALAVTIHVVGIKTLNPAMQNLPLLADYNSPEDAA
jgi:hypothetical protein